MSALESLIAEVENQEKKLQFEEFTSETALAIGMSIIERAKKENLVITLDITRCGHRLFHYSFEGTSPDNDLWVQYKNNIVNRFNMSSYLFRLKLEKGGQTLADKHLDPVEYGPWGGAFPINVKNVGTIGTITISGLDDKDDHGLAAWAIEKYISK